MNIRAKEIQAGDTITYNLPGIGRRKVEDLTNEEAATEVAVAEGASLTVRSSIQGGR